MALKDYEFEMKYCSRCSQCKWMPLNFIKSWRFSESCPAVKRYSLHAYSGGGRVIAALSIYRGRSEITDELLKIIYRCQMCGSCIVTCHLVGEIVEPLEIARELRIKCVEEGKLIPEAMAMIDGLKKEDNVLGEPKAERGKWAEDIDVKDINKEKTEVVFHAGCRASYDKDYVPIAKTILTILKNADVDVGIAGREEACCGGRAFDVGYKGELEKYAEDVVRRINASGAKVLVTPCSDCYSAFKQFYPIIRQKFDGIEVLHITQYLERLIKEGKIEPTKEVPMRVTYHDPCHLGKLGEPYEPWKGIFKKELGQVIVPDPPKQIRRGIGGVYDPPRNILKSIPGLELVEMERIREYSWCCGAGGGMKEIDEDFALWSAMERIEEAKATGAEAIVTACPWCERNFKDAIEKNGDKIKVFDVVELVQMAIKNKGEGK